LHIKVSKAQLIKYKVLNHLTKKRFVKPTPFFDVNLGFSWVWARYFFMSTTFPGPTGVMCLSSFLANCPISLLASWMEKDERKNLTNKMLMKQKKMLTCSIFVSWGFEFDFFRIPFAGAAVSKLGLLVETLWLEASLDDS